MNMNLYKKAVKDIVPNPELIHDTANKMRMVQQHKKSMIKRYAVVSCLAAVIMGALLLPSIEPITPNTPSNLEGNTPTNIEGKIVPPDNEKNQNKETVPEHNIALPQITKNYVPFQASDYHSTKLKAPNIPFYYEELKQQSDMVILCTISDIGVYSIKDNPLNPELSLNLATNIYTVKIDKILSGDMPESEGSFVPIGETVVASPQSRDHEAEPIEWNFTPYSFRPENVQLEVGKQYVMFLTEKDNTEVYRLSWDGFGVFPTDYIKKESEKNSLSELQKEYKYVEEVTRAPMENELLYRLCSLYVKEEFL